MLCRIISPVCLPTVGLTSKVKLYFLKSSQRKCRVNAINAFIVLDDHKTDVQLKDLQFPDNFFMTFPQISSANKSISLAFVCRNGSFNFPGYSEQNQLSLPFFVF